MRPLRRHRAVRSRRPRDRPRDSPTPTPSKPPTPRAKSPLVEAAEPRAVGSSMGGVGGGGDLAVSSSRRKNIPTPRERERTGVAVTFGGVRSSGRAQAKLPRARGGGVDRRVQHARLREVYG